MNGKERKAVALFNNNNVKGSVVFTQFEPGQPVNVKFNLYSLKPGVVRAIHIHEYGDERKGCTSLGGHWNPFNKTHGTILVPGFGRHAGDLINNITPDANGVFITDYNDELLNLFGDVTTTIIGRSVVIHDGVDDLGLGGKNQDGSVDLEKWTASLENGNAGSRMACAIIGIAPNN